MSKAEKDRQKQIQEKCQALLNQMLRDDDNKYCVDCDAKGPRWASWNLGIFLCIRCAGIHRNLGVHISKVKSVNLDTWTPEQVVSLQQMGNSRARAVYEANLPDNFRRPQTDSSLEAFVRAKYEQKKYIAREWVPPPIPKVDWDKELDEEAERQRKRKKEAKQAQTRKSSSSLNEVTVPQLLPKPKASTSPKPSRSSTTEAKTPKGPSQDLLGLDTPSGAAASGSVSANGEDIFTSFLSAPTSVESSIPTNKAEGRTAEEESFFNQPAPSTQEKRQLTKDSILALYSTGPAAQAAAPPLYGVPGGVYTQQSQGFAPATGPYGIPTATIPPTMSSGVLGMQPQIPAVMSTGVPVGMQNGVFPVASGIPSQAGVAPNLISNPFFNMGAAVPTTFSPGIGQEHAHPSAEKDLMLEYENYQTADPAQLPQQMSRMNIGGASLTGIPAQHPGAPLVMTSVGNMGLPTNPIASFTPQNTSGHTLATNLWQ